MLGTSFTMWGGHDILIEHTTIANNTSTSAWSSLVDANGNDVTLSHVIAYDNQGNATVRNNSASTVFEYSLVDASGGLHASITSEASNITGVDPQFVDAPKGDYTLAKGSPAIDAGDPKVLDPDGTIADLGAFGGPTR